MNYTLRRYLRSKTTEPAYAERQSASAIDPYAFQLSGWLKTEAARSRKQRRTVKQLHQDLTELRLKGFYDRVAAFAKKWRGANRVGQFSAQTNIDTTQTQ